MIVFVYVKYKQFVAEPQNENEPQNLDQKIYTYNGIDEPRTDNFSIDEFKCHNGTEVPKNHYGNVYKLMQNLQVLRDYIGLPIHINSGYRTPSYNKSIGGAPASKHLLSQAADIRVVGMSAENVREKILYLIQEGKMHNGGLGSYSNFTHYDVSVSRRWNG
ncbi:MAG: D-Ala-D-Ala carboxypeptidase family metallohydrolase [Chitinophagaceae bacterium]